MKELNYDSETMNQSRYNLVAEKTPFAEENKPVIMELISRGWMPDTIVKFVDEKHEGITAYTMCLLLTQIIENEMRYVRGYMSGNAKRKIENVTVWTRDALRSIEKDLSKSMPKSKPGEKTNSGDSYLDVFDHDSEMLHGLLMSWMYADVANCSNQFVKYVNQFMDVIRAKNKGKSHQIEFYQGLAEHLSEKIGVAPDEICQSLEDYDLFNQHF
jgi:hypothetical protein